MIFADIQSYIASYATAKWPTLAVIEESKCAFEQTITDTVIAGLNPAIIIRTPRIIRVIASTPGHPLVEVGIEVHCSQPQTYTGATPADGLFLDLVQAMSGRELLSGEASKPSYGGTRPIWTIGADSGYEQAAERDGVASYVLNLTGPIRIR